MEPHDDPNARPDRSTPNPSQRQRVEYPADLDDSEGRSSSGHKVSRSSEGDDGGEGRTVSSPNGDHLQGGYREGIPGKRLKDPTTALLQAFQDGDAEAAYLAAQDLTLAYHEAMTEASRLRFKLNFGSDVCERCDGMRAGPGVIATCFQAKRCDFTNIKAGQEAPLHQRIIQGLTRSK